jgi:hypothetical protein
MWSEFPEAALFSRTHTTFFAHFHSSSLLATGTWVMTAAMANPLDATMQMAQPLTAAQLSLAQRTENNRFVI